MAKGKKTGKSKTASCFATTLSIKNGKALHDKLCRCFNAMCHIHNVIVSYAMKQMRKLEKDTKYNENKAKYVEYLKKGEENLTPEEKKDKEKLASEMKEAIASYGLTSNGLEKYIQVCGHKYRSLLSSQQVAKEADRVYKGVAEILYGDGKELHYKSMRDMYSVCGKTIKNGIKFDVNTLTATWNGITIVCDKKVLKDPYIVEALKGKIKYCEIIRLQFNNGWHYYLHVYIDGTAPKEIKKEDLGKGTMGLDVGVSSVAGTSDNDVLLEEMAPDCDAYNKKIVKLQRRMEASRRATNPNKFNKDGTYKKGNKDRWVYSNTYYKLRRQLGTLYRKKAAYIKQSHEKLCNRLLKMADTFITEDMDFKALQKRAKNTEKRDKAEPVTKSDGTVKKIHKYKRKKRFGRSLNNRAPGEFLKILERKCIQYGDKLLLVDTKAFKASQYNHVTDTCNKTKLYERLKQVGDHIVQRDLYSSFLLKNANDKLDHPVREKCEKEFRFFVEIHNTLVLNMLRNGISMKQCFGF